MLASVRNILEQVSDADVETWLVQLQTLFQTHFLPDTGSSTSQPHEPVAQHHLLSFSSEPINNSLITDEEQRTVDSDSQDEVYTIGTINHVINCNKEEDADVTQTISSETV